MLSGPDGVAPKEADRCSNWAARPVLFGSIGERLDERTRCPDSTPPDTGSAVRVRAAIARPLSACTARAGAGCGYRPGRRVVDRHGVHARDGGRSVLRRPDQRPIRAQDPASGRSGRIRADLGAVRDGPDDLDPDECSVRQGVACGAGIVIARAMVKDLFDSDRLAWAFSMLLLMLVSGVAPVLAPVLGAQLLHVTDWRGLFVVLSLICSRSCSRCWRDWWRVARSRRSESGRRGSRIRCDALDSDVDTASGEDRSR